MLYEANAIRTFQSIIHIYEDPLFCFENIQLWKFQLLIVE